MEKQSPEYMPKPTQGDLEMKETNPYEDYKNEANEEIAKVLKRIEKEKTEREYTSLASYPIQRLGESINEITERELHLTVLGPENGELELPPQHITADFTLSAFRLAKKIGENPETVAQKITDELNKSDNPLINTAENVGAFVNLELNAKTLYPEILSNIHSLGERYGESDANASKVALVDYSAPNIAKPIGVGHLRSTIIGQALANIYRATGYTEIRDNHLGDWGTQFGALIYAYEQWGDQERVAKNPLRELKDLYVRFHAEAKEHPELEERAREIFKNLEEKDPQLMKTWKHFRDLSVKGFQTVYQRLGIEFDTHIGEGYFSEHAEDVTQECLQKEIARKDPDTGAVIVDSIGQVPSFLLKKQDGSSLYLTRDLATLDFRIKTFKPETILYAVGKEQELHFKQLFLLSQKLGLLKPETKAKHIEFGMILSEGKKMSTRKGTVVELDDLMDQAVAKSREIVLEKNPSLPPETIDQIAETVGVGAILYNDLRQSRSTNISFDWDKMLNFEGGSAVYLQYTCVRINSILRKVEKEYSGAVNVDPAFLSRFEKPTEFQMAKKLMLFPSVILRSQRFDSPHFLCGYLEELAQLFNTFYAEVSISGTTETDLRQSRIMLITAVKNVIEKGLSLLNINVPERM